MNEDEWEALQRLQLFESITFSRVQRRLTMAAATARQARELIERLGAGASVEVTRQETQKYIVKFNW
jgi:hypothetical protein